MKLYNKINIIIIIKFELVTGVVEGRSRVLGVSRIWIFQEADRFFDV
jgi:hypothetical protein